MLPVRKFPKTLVHVMWFILSRLRTIKAQIRLQLCTKIICTVVVRILEHKQVNVFIS